MAVYIKTKDGIKMVSNEDITKTDIEKGLGYTPSDFSGKYSDIEGAPDIKEDNTGAYYIVDTNGNIILKVDSEGLHTTDIELDGIESVKKKLESADSLTDDSNTLYVVDGNGNIIAKIDKDGIQTTSVTANEVYLNGEKLTDKLANILTSIKEDDTGALIICDENGNIIARINADGLKTTLVEAKKITLNGKDLEEELKRIEDNAGKSDFSGSYNDLSDKPSLFSGDYDDLTNKPIENTDENGMLYVTDEEGNIVATIGENGVNATEFYEKGIRLKTGKGANVIRTDSSYELNTEAFAKSYIGDANVGDLVINKDGQIWEITGERPNGLYYTVSLLHDVPNPPSTSIIITEDTTINITSTEYIANIWYEIKTNTASRYTVKITAKNGTTDGYAVASLKVSPSEPHLVKYVKAGDWVIVTITNAYALQESGTNKEYTLNSASLSTPIHDVKVIMATYGGFSYFYNFGRNLPIYRHNVRIVLSMILGSTTNNFNILMTVYNKSATPFSSASEVLTFVASSNNTYFEASGSVGATTSSGSSVSTKNYSIAYMFKDLLGDYNVYCVNEANGLHNLLISSALSSASITDNVTEV